MDAIKELLKLDYVAVILAIFVIMAGIIAIYTIVGKFSEIIGKPVKWYKKNKDDHKLVCEHTKAIQEMTEKHAQDKEEVIEHNRKMQEQLLLFVDEMRNEVKTFTNNRVNDRKQSLQIQEKLTNSIKELADANILKDKQIDSLIVAQKEMLAEKINEKYKYYLSIGGVPEDERDEFISLHDAYKGVGGNHNGDAKFEYCINHLPIIPVETKLVFENEE